MKESKKEYLTPSIDAIRLHPQDMMCTSTEAMEDPYANDLYSASDWGLD